MREPVVSSSVMYRQPRHALEPDAFSLEAMEQWALGKTVNLDTDRFYLTSFWNLDFTIQHTPGDRRTHYTGRLAQSENYGIAFSLTSLLQMGGQTPAVRVTDHALVGKDSRAILREGRYSSDIDRTALIDLVIGQTCAPENGRVIVDGLRHGKYARKSRIFADEAQLILERKGRAAIKGSKPHVLVIGAMAGAQSTRVRSYGDRYVARGGGAEARGSDGKRWDRDLVIVTGMALPNRTLEGILGASKRNNTSTMIWAVTGRNCGSYHIEHGVDCVISDPLHFLMLPGSASIGMWRREA
jgi:hypothetical protein